MKPQLFYHIADKLNKTGASWDKLAPSLENAVTFAHKNINHEAIIKKDKPYISLEYCLAQSGESLNEHFRNECLYEKDVEIAYMVATHTCKTDLVLYRGLCAHVYNLMIQNAKSIKGIDFYEKGYMQCSLIKGHELNYETKLRIYVPEGSSVIYLGNLGNYGNENTKQPLYEVVIQHGAKLKVISIDEKYINCQLLETA